MNTLFELLALCPRCWRVCGRIVFTVCGLLALSGLRLLWRADRIADRAANYGVHLDFDRLLNALPFWMPTAMWQVVGLVVLAVIGALVAWQARKIERWME